MSKNWYVFYSSNLNTVFYSDDNEKRINEAKRISELNYSDESLIFARFTDGYNKILALKEFVRIYLPDHNKTPSFKRI